ncbi:MAG: prepilin-type N-terminal cleavage/methylation domain-containing protein, partial [Candidatus Omnitrophica bacterium]|nr:prepilin-type N-terminal cleavage/methylation domain-containing protein [Candidatus Omnitrophota bacterium]MBL7197207.1 prepilin-type N-terminal cleavage/methylation domain-containing protein [Candidatus Omnitrophota bacterium]
MSKDTLKALTLIEILIALTIFSIIAVSLYSTFSSGILAWKKSEDVNRLY